MPDPSIITIRPYHPNDYPGVKDLLKEAGLFDEDMDAARILGWQTFFYDSANYDQSTQQLSDFLLRSLPE